MELRALFLEFIEPSSVPDHLLAPRAPLPRLSASSGLVPSQSHPHRLHKLEQVSHVPTLHLQLVIGPSPALLLLYPFPLWPKGGNEGLETFEKAQHGGGADDEKALFLFLHCRTHRLSSEVHLRRFRLNWAR